MNKKLIVLLFFVGFSGAWTIRYLFKEYSQAHIPKRVIGGDFSLSSDKGIVSLKNFRGKVVILYFGFLSCPDVCPVSLSSLKFVLKELDELLVQKIQTLFISVDYKRDTPKEVGEYVKYFDDSFIGLTGTKEQIDKVVKQYAAYYKFSPLKGSHMKYTVEHTSRFYVINQMGKFIESFSDVKNDKKFIALIKKLLY